MPANLVVCSESNIAHRRFISHASKRQLLVSSFVKAKNFLYCECSKWARSHISVLAYLNFYSSLSLSKAACWSDRMSELKSLQCLRCVAIWEA